MAIRRFFLQRSDPARKGRASGVPGFLRRTAVSLAIAPVVPLVAMWVNAQERRILREGRVLTPEETAMAAKVGVAQTAKIRVLMVEDVPLPAYPWMLALLEKAGAPPILIAGMTLGHGIYVRRDYGARPLLMAHECVHVAQYERLGSSSAFLFRYLRECLTVGYHNSPMEREASDVSVQAFWEK